MVEYAGSVYILNTEFAYNICSVSMLGFSRTMGRFPLNRGLTTCFQVSVAFGPHCISASASFWLMKSALYSSGFDLAGGAGHCSSIARHATAFEYNLCLASTALVKCSYAFSNKSRASLRKQKMPYSTYSRICCRHLIQTRRLRQIFVETQKMNLIYSVSLEDCGLVCSAQKR